MLTAVDLFCGSGGVTTGLRSAGWKVLAACDNDPIVAETYQKNHPDVALVRGDINCDETISALVDGMKGRTVDLLVVCAPCQPFSSQNRKRGKDDREKLIIRALATVNALNPALIFFENVPGLASPSYAPILMEVKTTLNQLGYHISDPMVRDAADYGAPQRRRRCIMLAAQSTEAIAAFCAMDATLPRKTVYDAISDLPKLASGERDPCDMLHRARSHQPIVLERLRHIPRNGGGRSSLPDRLILACHKNNSDFPDVYGRMQWEKVSPTLTTGCCDVTKGRFAHPEQDRAITLREAARLQTFPDQYVFKGNASQIARQIGNAVPPAMISAFSVAFRKALSVAEGSDSFNQGDVHAQTGRGE